MSLGADRKQDTINFMSSSYDEIDDENFDKMMQEFVETDRKILDLGVRIFVDKIIADRSQAAAAQDDFALYVLGRISPAFDFWDKKLIWEVHEPS